MSKRPTAKRPLIPYEWPGSYLFDEEERLAVNKVIDARSPFRYYGHDLQHFADRLEEAYRQRLGRKHALAVNSGTSALSIAMTMLDVGPGDEVLVPGYFWVSCASAVVRAGAIPKLVEIDDTFVMDPDDLARKISEHSKAVLLVHMSGATGRLDRLLEVARHHGLPVIEDVAQANGASFRGQPLGAFGEMAIFSFQYNKAITAGEGGLLVCDDDEFYRRAVAAHDLGYPRNESGRLVTEDPATQLWGQGSRMSELSAAMLVAQESKLDRLIGQMRSLNDRLYRELGKISAVTPRSRPDPSGDNGAFVILSWPDPSTNAAMIAATRSAGVVPGPKGLNNLTFNEWGLHLYYNNASLVHRRGVNSRGYPWADPANAFAAHYSYRKGELPRADDLFARSSLLAVPPAMSDDEVEAIVEIYHECARDQGLEVHP
ncbi:MAG: aminotransferase class I/II-fold pyridoxal phosphate-dependent enzyme [Trueperaceae bacterium]